jgi:hypothetical protein
MAAQRPSAKRPPGQRPSVQRPSGRAAGWAAAAAGWAVAAARSETGRRLARAVTLTVALAALITTLYDRGETPRAAAQPAVAAPAPGARGGPAARAAGAPGGASHRSRAGAARQDPGEVGGLRGRPRPAMAGERPAAVAAAWYAARQGVPATKVQALQQDRLSAREVRVLVLADHGHGRLRTALVRVRQGPTGWSVR